jgi:TatD DNase family protein
VLIDTHCHLDAHEFDRDRDEVLARAVAAGVRAQVIPAIAQAGFAGLRALCAGRTDLYPAYGLHPMYLAGHRPQHLDDLREWLEREKPVAIGECGLDFFIAGLDAGMQRFYFDRQLELAREFDLPVIVHARRAVDEVIATLRRIGAAGSGAERRLRGVVHSFSGSAEQARQLWKLDFLLGIGGPVTYERGRRLRALVAQMPIEFLLLETDAPDQPLQGHRGERNEPARLGEVLATVAALRAQAPAELAAATTANAVRLFGLRLPAAG